MKQKILRGAALGVVAALGLAVSGTALAIDNSSTMCVKVPGQSGLSAGVASGLTGAILVPVLPATRSSTICGTVSCSYTGSLTVADEAPSFPDCDLPVSIDADGTGTCTILVTRTTGFRTRTLYSKTVSITNQDAVLPVELCLTRPEAE